VLHPLQSNCVPLTSAIIFLLCGASMVSLLGVAHATLREQEKHSVQRNDVSMILLVAIALNCCALLLVQILLEMISGLPSYDPRRTPKDLVISHTHTHMHTQNDDTKAFCKKAVMFGLQVWFI